MASVPVWLLQLVLMNSAAGDYLISDSLNDRLQLCPSLHPGSPCETVFSGFDYPMHVEVVDGDYLVADYFNHRIQLCPAASPLTACATVGAVSGEGSGATQLGRPTAATVDADGYLIITDSMNHRVQRCLFVAYSNSGHGDKWVFAHGVVLASSHGHGCCWRLRHLRRKQ